MTPNDTAIDEYLELVPKGDRDVAQRLDELDSQIMGDAINAKMYPKAELNVRLMEVTALYSFFSSRYYRWKAICDNREVEEYIRLKRESVAAGVKFVSAPTEREAEKAVTEVNYLVSFYEGNLKRCEQYVNTLKRLLEAVNGEKA